MARGVWAFERNGHRRHGSRQQYHRKLSLNGGQVESVVHQSPKWLDQFMLITPSVGGAGCPSYAPS